MTPNLSLTLADVFEIYADHFISDSARIDVKDPDATFDIKALLLEIFNTPHVLKADINIPPPLTPGHYYCLTQQTCLQHPDCLLLTDATPEQGNKKYLLSVLDFFNTFASRQLPLDEHEFNVSQE